MKIRKFLYVLLFLILLAGVYLILVKFLPKSSGYLPVFLVLVLFDLYLWNSLKNKIFKFRPFLKYFLSILYWIPFVTLVTYTVLSAFIPVQNLFTGPSIYVLGFVFTAIASKLIPALFLFVADFFRLAKCAVNRFSAKASKHDIPNGKAISRSRFLVNLGLITGGIVTSATSL